MTEPRPNPMTVFLAHAPLWLRELYWHKHARRGKERECITLPRTVSSDLSLLHEEHYGLESLFSHTGKR